MKSALKLGQSRSGGLIISQKQGKKYCAYHECILSHGTSMQPFYQSYWECL